MIRFTKSFLILFLIFIGQIGHTSVTLLDKDDWKFLVSGFAELDTIYDSTRGLTEVVGNAAVARPSTVKGDTAQTQMSIRNSRLAFSVLPPVQNDWKSKGYLEFDLLGYDPSPSATAPTNSESSFYTNPTLRVRHAYLNAENNGWSVTAGQTWTFFGWNPNYVLTTASVAPVSGTVYQRTPQIAVIKAMEGFSDKDKLQVGLSIVRPSQRDSQMPNFDGGFRYSYGGRRAGFSSANGEISAEPMSIAVTGTVRQFVTTAAGDPVTADTNRYYGDAIAVDALIPIIASEDGKSTANTLTLTGEFTAGAGYSDSFSSWTGNLSQMTAASGSSTNPSANLDAGQGGFDTSGNFQLAKLQTFNAQLQYHLPEGWNSFVTLGYGQLYFLNSGSYAPVSGTVFYDRPETFFVNFFHDFTKQVRAALEYDRFTTHYVDGSWATDNRVQISTYLRF